MQIPKPAKDIAEADLERLIAAAVREGQQIEYKEKLNIQGDEQKRKFLASIASFANASGGDLIFGIKASNGVPEQLVELENFDPDRDIRTLRDIIRAHIDPPLFGIEFREVPLKSGQALLIRVPRSLGGAHMVTFNDDNRFYTRDQNGRVLMNIPEIRAAFTVSETLAQRIRRFRAERLSAIRSEEIAVQLEPASRYVLHLLPFRSFEPGYQADLDALLRNGHDFRPLKSASGLSLTHDVEGCYAYERLKDQVSYGYSLAFRTGAIEVVYNFFGPPLAKRFIPNPGFESDLFRFFPKCVQWLRTMEVDPPVAISLSLLDVKEFTLYFGPGYEPHSLRRMRHRDLIIPESLMETFDTSPASVLRPIFDAIWQACGLQRSFNFTEAGEFKPDSR